METKLEDDPGAPAPRLPPGTPIGAYKIERVLGEGAMGLVYLAVHESLGRRVAIKALKPQAEANASLVERFLAEAIAVNIIGHENIVECTDTITSGGRTFVVMELLEGRSLRDALRGAGRIAPGRAIRIAIQIARAIGAAHAKDIVHRDLKPENVFLIHRGDNPDYVKVLDFGIARLRPELGYVTATQSGALMGTPAYMSPEQVAGERATAVADVYALGIILFELISGRLPFVAKNIGLMLAAQVSEKPKRLDEVAPGTPKALADLVAHMLEKDPAARPPSMLDVERRLEDVLGAADAAVIATNPDAFGETLLPAPSRRPRWLVAAGIAAVAAIGLAAWRLTITESPRTPDPGTAAVALDAAIDAPVDAAPADAAIDARGARREPDDQPPQAFQLDRAAYIANTRALIGPTGRYARALDMCWGIHKKVTRDKAKTRAIVVRFEIYADGSHGNVSTDVPPDPRPGRDGREDLGTCLVWQIEGFYFARPHFEVAEPIAFELRVLLK